ncbi:MAG: hypothetical protein ABEK17_02660, partial [Candidatus Aenigmatarchaeota archaeon]
REDEARYVKGLEYLIENSEQICINLDNKDTLSELRGYFMDDIDRGDIDHTIPMVCGHFGMTKASCFEFIGCQHEEKIRNLKLLESSCYQSLANSISYTLYDPSTSWEYIIDEKVNTKYSLLSNPTDYSNKKVEDIEETFISENDDNFVGDYCCGRCRKEYNQIKDFVGVCGQLLDQGKSKSSFEEIDFKKKIYSINAGSQTELGMICSVNNKNLPECYLACVQIAEYYKDDENMKDFYEFETTRVDNIINDINKQAKMAKVCNRLSDGCLIENLKRNFNFNGEEYRVGNVCKDVIGDIEACFNYCGCKEVNH